MLVNDVMIKDVISVSPDTLIEKVSEKMIKNRIHAIPVVEDDKLIGIITETDFFTKGSLNIYLPEYIKFIKKDGVKDDISEQQKEKMRLLLNTRAADVMSHPCITIKENAKLEDFFSLVKLNKLISVPVINEKDELVGIITLADVINLIKV